MITVLLIAALALTALTALMLPFGGWPRGIDAAGKGMALYFPLMFMAGRIVCIEIAVVIVAAGSGFGWTSLPPLGGGVLAAAVVAGLGGLSFAAALLLGEKPLGEGRFSFGIVSIVFAPLVVVLWLFAESYGAAAEQAWIVRGLVLVSGLVPLFIWWRVAQATKAEHAVEDRKAAADEVAAQAQADKLPANASLLETLTFHAAMDEQTMARARDKVMERFLARPALHLEYAALLADPDLGTRVTAGLYMTTIQPQSDAAYWAAALPTLEAIVADLEDGRSTIAAMVRETKAAIGLAWPALHSAAIPKALMVRFHDAVVNRGADNELGQYAGDAKILADLVQGPLVDGPREP